MKSLTFLLFLFCSLNLIYSQSIIHIPGDYPTIQAGINAANNGDIVLVDDGTYYENINFKGKGITVASNFFVDGDYAHIENTIINGSQPSNPDSASVVEFNNFEDSTSVLCGFTITGGKGTDYGYARFGGGIILTDAGPIIKNNIIECDTVVSNDAIAAGSAIALGLYTEKTLVIENNIIRNNWCETKNLNSSCHGAIYITQGNGTVIIRNNYIHSNTIEGDNITNGGGISGFGYNSIYATLIIEDNIISNNVVNDGTASTAQLGGGIFLENYNAYVRNNIIAYNKARGSGGFHYYTPSPIINVKPTLENNLIFGNIAGSRQGGGISTHMEYDVINCIIWGNTVPQYNYQQVTTISYSNIEDSYSNGNNNISIEPEFLDTTYFLLSNISPCADSGSPDPMYNDLEDPDNPGSALWPAFGTLRNDIGHFGGPNSSWHKWEWPLYYLPSEPILIAPTDTVNNSDFTFIWTECSPMVTAYWFEIDTTDNFTTPFIDSLITDNTYLFSNLINAKTYWWRVKAYNDFGWGIFSEIGTFPVIITAVGNENQLPTEFNLCQNYPNPFNPGTTIKYSVPQTSQVQIKVYDVLGNEIETLVNDEKPAGIYEITWYANNLPSGVYFYRLQTSDFIETKKMVVIK